MKPKKIIAGLVAVLSVALLFAFTRADDDPIKKIVTQLAKWNDENPQEKVYLHMDKPFYAAGEDIWFKAYVTVGPKHQLSALSGVLNVELINERDSIKQSIKLPVYAGMGWGDFALPDTLKAGNYRIRAYTNYMRNAGDDYFFDKTFSIGNSVANNVFTKVNYTYATQNGQPKISAAITYIDLNGLPYGNKEVSYDVQVDFKSIAKGKALTDANGVVNISFANNAPNMLKAGRIVTNLKYADKKVSTQTLPVKAAGNKVDVQFFPEGGTLVTGVRSKIAFKATAADGLGVAVTGVVKDNDDKEVCKLGTAHFGMGYFVFIPMPGKTYKAYITNPDGAESTLALPASVDKGYSLMVTSTDPEKVAVRISVSQDMVAEAQQNEISIIAQQNGVVCYAAKSKLTTSSFAASIPKSRFPTGIVQFTLFSATGEPLNERLIFVQNPDALKLSVNTEKQSYGPRQKVKINVNAKDAANQPMLGSFSAAVVDESKVPVDESAETTILSSLLLTSDLKGYIEKPNYYFTTINEQTQADLDVLMLTQGYRRFVWKQILNDVFPAMAFQPEKYISVTGTIKTSGGKPVPRAKVTMLSSKGGAFILDTVADDQGKFAFTKLVFKDSVRFVIQARTEKGKKDVEIEVDKIAAPAITRNRNAPDLQISINNVMTDYLKNSKSLFNEQVKYGVGDHVTVLKEVVIKETKKPESHSDNLNGAGGADQTIKSDQLSSCPTLEMCLNGRAAFVLFRGGIPYSTRSPNRPMLIVLDGMTMSDDFTLDNITPQDVESVEVLRTIQYTAIYGSRGSGGVLVVTTKRGGDDTNTIRYAPGIITYAPKGYYKAREFYAPEYDNPKTNTQMADLRTTIFWKPNMLTDKDGNASFEFFNADGKGTYRVVVEGIDNNGNLARQIYRYKVE
jgi:hypothetical protein